MNKSKKTKRERQSFPIQDSQFPWIMSKSAVYLLWVPQPWSQQPLSPLRSPWSSAKANPDSQKPQTLAPQIHTLQKFKEFDTTGRTQMHIYNLLIMSYLKPLNDYRPKHKYSLAKRVVVSVW